MRFGAGQFRMRFNRRWLLLGIYLASLVGEIVMFVPDSFHKMMRLPRRRDFIDKFSQKLPVAHLNNQIHTTTELSMVFDFFKQKTSEGFEQLNNIADATYKGNIGKGLADAAAYTKASNAAFASGLAKSRNQLLQNLEGLFTGVSPEELLEDLQDILLQSDLGIAVSEEIVDEVKSLRDESTKMLSQDDLRSILRGKLIEALNTGKSEAIHFSTDEDLPTVIFVIGANGMGVSYERLRNYDN